MKFKKQYIHLRIHKYLFYGILRIMYKRKNKNNLLCARVLPTYYCCAIGEKRLYLRANILYGYRRATTVTFVCGKTT